MAWATRWTLDSSTALLVKELLRPCGISFCDVMSMSFWFLVEIFKLRVGHLSKPLWWDLWSVGWSRSLKLHFLQPPTEATAGGETSLGTELMGWFQYQKGRVVSNRSSNPNLEGSWRCYCLLLCFLEEVSLLIRRGNLTNSHICRLSNIVYSDMIFLYSYEVIQLFTHQLRP